MPKQRRVPARLSAPALDLDVESRSRVRLIHEQSSALDRTARRPHVTGMNKPTVDPSQLSVEERLELIDRLWESVARDAPERLDLSPEEEAEIDRRSEELHANPDLAVPWDTARTGILKDLERGG